MDHSIVQSSTTYLFVERAFRGCDVVRAAGRPSGQSPPWSDRATLVAKGLLIGLFAGCQTKSRLPFVSSYTFRIIDNQEPSLTGPG
jgi:hypothetical protein